MPNTDVLHTCTHPHTHTHVPPDEVAVVAERFELLGSDVGAVLAHDDAEGGKHLQQQQLQQQR